MVILDDIPRPLIWLILIGATCSISGLFLFIGWRHRRNGKNPPAKSKNSQALYRRKKGGRKRYR